jgi:hypothetical protein
MFQWYRFYRIRFCGIADTTCNFRCIGDWGGWNVRGEMRKRKKSHVTVIIMYIMKVVVVQISLHFEGVHMGTLVSEQSFRLCCEYFLLKFNKTVST